MHLQRFKRGCLCLSFLVKFGTKFAKIFVTKIPEDESDKEERFSEFAQTNWSVISYVADACSENDAAMQCSWKCQLKEFVTFGT